MTPGEDTWLIDSGASKHITGQNNTLFDLIEKESPQKFHLEMIISTQSKEWEKPPTNLIQELR
jgi:hypothetical protein